MVGSNGIGYTKDTFPEDENGIALEIKDGFWFDAIPREEFEDRTFWTWWGGLNIMLGPYAIAGFLGEYNGSRVSSLVGVTTDQSYTHVYEQKMYVWDWNLDDPHFRDRGAKMPKDKGYNTQFDYFNIVKGHDNKIYMYGVGGNRRSAIYVMRIDKTKFTSWAMGALGRGDVPEIYVEGNNRWRSLNDNPGIPKAVSPANRDFEEGSAIYLNNINRYMSQVFDTTDYPTSIPLKVFFRR